MVLKGYDLLEVFVGEEYFPVMRFALSVAFLEVFLEVFHVHHWNDHFDGYC